MSMNTGLNENDVKTALDEKFWSKWNEKPGPNWADVSDPMIFRQDSTRLAAETNDVQNDPGAWESREDEETITSASVKSAFKKTWSVANYLKAVKVPKYYMDDEQWGTVSRMVENMARKGRYTQRKTGFGVFRDGFTTFTTNSGVALFSASHANINGDTVSNYSTAALAPASLEAGTVSLAEQKDQSGDIGGYEARCLLVPPALFMYACEITDSEMKADTTDNNLNAFSTKYNIYVKQHSQLGAAAGGSDTAWYLLGADHNLIRWIRQPIVTDYVHYTNSDQRSSTYIGEYREMYGAITYEGVYGSTGAA